MTFIRHDRTIRDFDPHDELADLTMESYLLEGEIYITLTLSKFTAQENGFSPGTNVTVLFGSGEHFGLAQIIYYLEGTPISSLGMIKTSRVPNSLKPFDRHAVRIVAEQRGCITFMLPPQSMKRPTDVNPPDNDNEPK